MLTKLTEHPASVGETYSQHMAMALGFSVRMGLAALAALIHAFLPFLFEKTASRMISDLHQRMLIQRHRQPTNQYSRPERLRQS